MLIFLRPYFSDITATSNDNLLFDEAYIELLKCAFGVDHEKMPAPGYLFVINACCGMFIKP